MEIIKFDTLGLDPKILRAITEMGFEEPSPIQAKAIPEVMAGHDVIGQAQTGTGKTAAFGIPLLQKIDPKNRKLQAIILCPTRELAIQVADEIRRLSKFMHGIKILPVYGGQDIGKPDPFLKRWCAACDRNTGPSDGSSSPSYLTFRQPSHDRAG